MQQVGVKQKFETILRDTHARLRAYIAGMGVAAHEVDDLAQDVYLELYKNFEKIPDDVEPVRWLTGIARNVCMNHFRRRTRRSRLQRQALAEILARTPYQSEATLHDGSVEGALDQCLSKLPAKSKRIVKLRYADGGTCFCQAGRWARRSIGVGPA